MSGAELSKAAETLRKRAEAATDGPWIPFGTSIGVTVKGCTCAGTAPGYPQHESYCGTDGPIVDASEPDIAYIATMHPGVGLALADWLDDAATWAEETGNVDRHALTVARLINGGAS